MFYKAISEFYDQIFPFSEKKKNFLTSLITGSTTSLLDVGCATGELVFYGEVKGLSSFGIDNDQYLLEIALDKKKRINSDAVFLNSDMRKVNEIFERENFDLITCMGNTLSHLGSPEEVSGFFRSVHTLLKDKGVFFCQMVNYEKIVPDGSFFFNEIENDEFKFIRGNKINKDEDKVRFSGELILKRDGERYRNEIDLFPVSKALMEKELNATGFHSIKFYGGFDRKPFDRNSNALIFVAEK